MEQTIEFKIVWNKNKQVCIEGYVDIPSNECKDEEIDWYYYDAQGFATPQMFIEHYGVKNVRATEKQKCEIDQFENDYLEDALWIDTAICESNEDENRTYVRKNCTLIINDGAKMECEIKECKEVDYWAYLTFSFNGKPLNLDSDIMEWLAEDIDFTYSQEGHYEIKNGSTICREISKNHYGVFTSDEFWIEQTNEIVEEHCEDARKYLAMQFTRNLGVYSKYGEVMEQYMDNEYDNEWLFKLSQVSDETLEEFIKSEIGCDE